MNSNMDKITSWLLEGQPWITYRTRLDLLNQSPDDTEVKRCKEQMRKHPWIQQILQELKEWPGSVMKNHKQASHLLHKLAFIAELDFSMEDADISAIVKKILLHASPEGPFEILTNIPVRFGGSGKDSYAWTLCDSPTITYALLRFGLQDNNMVKHAVSYLVSLLRDNGWPCAASQSLQKFHGPGKKTDPCPYASLIMLKMLSALPDNPYKKETRSGINTLSDLWEKRKKIKPYLFGMGTDFMKLKTPFIWYDILHVMDVLSRFPGALKDPSCKKMSDIIFHKADDQGLFKAESVWMAWKDWDFGQKKAPSRWITLISYKILKKFKKNLKI